MKSSNGLGTRFDMGIYQKLALSGLRRAVLMSEIEPLFRFQKTTAKSDFSCFGNVSHNCFWGVLNISRTFELV